MIIIIIYIWYNMFQYLQKLYNLLIDNRYFNVYKKIREEVISELDKKYEVTKEYETDNDNKDNDINETDNIDENQMKEY